MPPEAMTTAMPRAMRPISALSRVTLSRLEKVRKFGERAVNTTSSRTIKPIRPAERPTPPRAEANGVSVLTARPRSDEPVACHREEEADPVYQRDPVARDAQDDDSRRDD